MSVKERTQKDIANYIKMHSKDGKLTKSIFEIAKDLGYSNATIHRALKALQEKGLVEIKQAPKPTTPNTILYKGSINQIDDLLHRGVELIKKTEELQKELHDYLFEIKTFLSQSGNNLSVEEIEKTDY